MCGEQPLSCVQISDQLAFTGAFLEELAWPCGVGLRSRRNPGVSCGHNPLLVLVLLEGKAWYSLSCLRPQLDVPGYWVASVPN